MQTLKLRALADKEGIVRLEIPTDQADREIEIVLVMQAVEGEAVDAMGYPIGYFEETFGMFADDPIERHQPPYPDVRDELA